MVLGILKRWAKLRNMHETIAQKHYLRSYLRTNSAFFLLPLPPIGQVLSCPTHKIQLITTNYCLYRHVYSQYVAQTPLYV